MIAELADENRLHRARDALLMNRFVPGLREGHDHFLFTKHDSEAYAGITDTYVKAGLGAGWGARHDRSRDETVFIRHIDCEQAIKQIEADLMPAD